MLAGAFMSPAAAVAALDSSSSKKSIHTGLESTTDKEKEEVVIERPVEGRPHAGKVLGII